MRCEKISMKVTLSVTDAKGKLAELPLFICIFQASEGKHEVSKVYEARVMAKGLPLLA